MSGITAILGFGGLAGAAEGIAKILFFIIMLVFLLTLISGLFRK
ncbi:DUF1328 domain-containing protein [Sediminicola arcticus]|jgi:uncharacterized membrane protein YtjA (UPF0391 family)|uniref:DUF1328 domain-containing protein n=1 Tax=Sediminicola arcticus TaxID=1574308 RepID=A0ABV2STR5_9FLAO